MFRWLAVSLVVACGGGREVSKVKYTRTSCDDCAIAPAQGQQFAPTDDERPVITPEQDPGAIASAKAPEPTCRLVGEVIASLEVGNYAEPAEREPKVAAAEKRCAAQRTTRDDRQCLIDSYDKAGMAYCIPALFPDVPLQVIAAADCDTLDKQVRTQLGAQTQIGRAAWETNLAVMVASCKGDRWNPAMLQCAQTSTMALYPQNCMYVQPPAIWKRFSTRLEAAKARK